MSPDQTFAQATGSYEGWRARRIPIVDADLARKHELLARSPFVLLRGTYYRFLQQFELRLPELASAPPAIVVGDLHVENYGTWRDRDGRLAWGINDLDEVDLLPYTVDLVRLATSALLAIGENHLAVSREAACEAIHGGWQERIARRAPETFVLGERHGHLYKLASESFTDPAKFERTLRALPEWEGDLPRPAMRLLSEVVPWSGFAPEHRTRVAGVGSLGSRRVVVLGELAGGLIVREAKQIPGPASMWIWSKRTVPRGLADAVADARGVAADPWRRQSGKWVLRRLAPDATRLELGALRRKHDEAAFLASMGAEAANIHLVRHTGGSAAKALLKDDRGRPSGWLLAAARTMAELTERDHAEWLAAKPQAAPAQPQPQPDPELGGGGRLRRGEPEAGGEVAQHINQVRDLLVGVRRGQLNAESDLVTGNQRVGGKRYIDPLIEQEATNFIDLLGLGERNLDDRVPGAVRSVDAELGELIQDAPGHAVKLEAQPIPPAVVDIEAFEDRRERGDRRRSGVEVGGSRGLQHALQPRRKCEERKERGVGL